MTTTTSKAAVTTPIPGPGALLAQARLDLRWSREEVATKLHLATRQIQALEEDDYASLPGPTYARGYLKSYALLLGLSPETVLAAHTRLTSRPVQQDFSTIAPQKEITSRHHQVRFTTYLVVAVVIGLAAAWWVGREPRAPAVPTPAAMTDQQASVPTDDSATPVATDARPPEPGPDVAPATAAAPVPAAPVALSPVARPPVPAAAPAPTVPTVTAPAPVAPLPATGPRVKLVLHADQDAWADIRDARQVKLLYETVPAGRAVTLEGLAPVTVFLGNPGGTRIEFNGKLVDIERHKRGLVARFTLGGEEAAPVPVP